MIKKHLFRPQPGFTLIEVVVGIGVLVVLLFSLFNLYLAYGSLYTSQNNQLTIVAAGRSIMSELGLYTVQAYRVVGNYTIATTTYYSSTTTLALQIPAINSGGSIINNTWDYVVFYANGTNLYRTIAADGASSRISGTRKLTNYLQNITFTYDNADLTLAQKVSIDLNLQNQEGNYTATNHLTEQLTLRNF